MRAMRRRPGRRVRTASGDRKISEISQVLTGQQVRRRAETTCVTTMLSLIEIAGNEVRRAMPKISEISLVCVGGDLRACPGKGESEEVAEAGEGVAGRIGLD